MAKIIEVKCFLPEEIYKDFCWTVRVKSLSKRQSALTAIEDYIAKVKEQMAQETEAKKPKRQG